MATTQERLDEVRAAISSVLTTGQAISGEGRSMTAANLGQLRELEKSLMQQLASEKGAASKRRRITYVVPG
jgi:hypothetical protein